MAVTWSEPTRRPLPVILIRGFGGLGVDDERQIAYQGFNTGTHYPKKRGENYIYEGFLLRMMKSRWAYEDGANVIAFYPDKIADAPAAKRIEGLNLPKDFFTGDRIVVDPEMARRWLAEVRDPLRTLWVYRYYDFADRKFETYGAGLVRLIRLVRGLVEAKTGLVSPVNIVAHSMGGLIAREAIQKSFPSKTQVDVAINKLVTFGTPHKGIAFQVIRDPTQFGFDAADELKQFNPKNQADKNYALSAPNLPARFPLPRLLCVAGADYRSYSVKLATLANRLFSATDDGGPSYNRSDGLVKLENAAIDDAPRTYVNKCHGGNDSLLTARESYEVATRFFFGDLRVRLRLKKAEVKRRSDLFGRDEIFFGVSIKPRRLDFELFHQSARAENCYGAFRKRDLSDPNPTFGWAGPDRLIWEGWLDSGKRVRSAEDLVLRADIYVGERDVYGIGHSDTLVFHRAYFIRAFLDGGNRLLEGHVNDNFERDSPNAPVAAAAMDEVAGGWEADLGDDNFTGRIRVEFDGVPEDGAPVPL